jgi:23S rRNA pseudouridine1911/1915/1917 synthase
MAENTITHISVPDEKAGMRLDVWITAALDMSRSRVQALIKSGDIRLADGTAVKPNMKTVAGAELVVDAPEPAPVDIVAEDIPLDVLYEDADLIVINKAAGLVVHPAPGHPDGTLVNALLFHCHDLEGIGGELRPGIVHRLDRDTSGVMVVAKRESSMDSLTRQFRDREVEKEYVAVLHGVPHPGVGRVETLIGRSSRDRKKMSVQDTHGRTAITTYHLSEVFDGFCFMKIGIETGRTHQIRVHMAHIGNPVVGDSVYGGRRERNIVLPVPVKRQMLHAASLTIEHPSSGKRLTFEAPMAPDMVLLLDALRA